MKIKCPVCNGKGTTLDPKYAGKVWGHKDGPPKRMCPGCHGSGVQRVKG